MSGGRFDYLQYRIFQVADEVEQLIERFSAEDESASSEEAQRVCERYALARDRLREAGKMLHRIDYYVSCDDSLESFLRRWSEDGCELPKREKESV